MKSKINYIFSYSKKKELGHSLNQIKAEPRSNSVNSSDVWDSLMIFWDPKGLLAYLSRSVIYSARTSLGVSGCLPTHVLFSCLLAIPHSWHLQCADIVLKLRLEFDHALPGFSLGRLLPCHAVSSLCLSCYHDSCSM